MVRIVVVVVACSLRHSQSAPVVAVVHRFASNWKCHPSPFAVIVQPVLIAAALPVLLVTVPARILVLSMLQRLPPVVV